MERVSDWVANDDHAREIAVTEYSVGAREVMAPGTTHENGGITPPQLASHNIGPARQSQLPENTGIVPVGRSWFPIGHGPRFQGWTHTRGEHGEHRWRYCMDQSEVHTWVMGDMLGPYGRDHSRILDWAAVRPHVGQHEPCGHADT